MRRDARQRPRCALHPRAGVELRARGALDGRPLYVCTFCRREWTEGNPYDPTPAPASRRALVPPPSLRDLRRAATARR